MAKKLSTEEILKQIRGADGAGGGSAPADSPAPEASPAEAAAEAPAEETPAKPAKKAGGSVLDQIRGGGGAKPAAAEKPAAAKPAGGPAPKGTSDILAALRGGKGGGATPAAAAKSAPKKKAASAPAGDLPPVDEMLAQMKAGKKPETVEAPEKPTLKIPTRPAPKVEKASRRAFLDMVLSPFALAWIFLATTAGSWVLLLARYMFPNMIVEPPTSFKIGPPSDYPLGTVSTKWTAARGIWVVHTDSYKGKDLIYVLASVCTHLGCTPSWLEGEQKFKCPCHGSGFYINGINFEGPAPRPLERVGVALAPDGMLEVDKAVKFQEEKGQWEDTKSFVDGSLV